MSHIDYALSCIMREIPMRILSAAFQPQAGTFNQYITLDDIIRQEVLDKVVNRDTNIVTGQVTTIGLSQLPWQTTGEGYLIEIPPSARGGRPITSVLGLEQTVAHSEGGNPLSPGSTGYSEVYVIPPATLFIPVQLNFTAASVRVVLGNNENLSNLPVRTQKLYGRLAVLAAKAIINTRLQLGINHYVMGDASADGMMRGVIDGYGDAWTMYHELLEGRWSRVHVLTDRNYHHRYIKGQLRPF